MALSGQQADMTVATLTFAPRLTAPYSLPVLLPGVVGTVSSPAAGHYELALTVGSLALNHLAVNGAAYPHPVTVTPAAPASWTS